MINPNRTGERIGRIATIQILIDTDEEGMAEDAITEILTNGAMHFPDSLIMDWSYVPDGEGDYASPAPVQIPAGYEEGDIFDLTPLEEA